MQTAHMLLDLHSQLSDELLSCNCKIPIENVGRNSLDESCSGDRSNNERQSAQLMQVHHIVDQIARRDRNGKTAETIDDDQQATTN